MRQVDPTKKVCGVTWPGGGRPGVGTLSRFLRNLSRFLPTPSIIHEPEQLHKSFRKVASTSGAWMSGH